MHHWPQQLRLTQKRYYCMKITSLRQKNIRHYYRFGIMPRLVGSVHTPSVMYERHYVESMARGNTAQSREYELLCRVKTPHKCIVTTLHQFNINQRVCFHRRIYGWHEGSVDIPTIYVAYENRLYPTYNARAHPHFSPLSLPPDLLNDPHSDLSSIPKTALSSSSSESPFTLTFSAQSVSLGRAPVSEFLNGVFLCSCTPTTSFNYLPVSHPHLAMIISQSHPRTISSGDVSVPILENIKKLDSQPPSDRAAFDIAITDELEFLLEHFVRHVLLRSVNVTPNVELQPSKGIFNIKRSIHFGNSDRYWACLVSACQRSSFRHSVHGASPNVSILTNHTLAAVSRAWSSLNSINSPLIVFCHEVKKAYFQSTPSQRLIINKAPKEFWKLYSQFDEYFWLAVVKVLEEVKADFY